MLYKHRAINNRFWPALESEEIWCPSAHSLNDPYEFDFRLRTSSVDGHPIIQGEFEKAKEDMKKMGVVSFVEINNSMLMWSFYSDGHKGVCLGFERNDTNELGNWDYCVPVRYHQDNEMPALMPLDLAKHELVTEILITKSHDWRHEREWRLLSRKSDVALAYPGRLRRVVFGINTEVGHRRRIREILGDTVDYFEVSKSKRYFVLCIEPAPGATAGLPSSAVGRR